MLIVADENIPLLDEFFLDFGEIRRCPGRAIDASAVADADVLLVRSVTRVDQQLLAGSQVAFVGTCTTPITTLTSNTISTMLRIVSKTPPGADAANTKLYQNG